MAVNAMVAAQNHECWMLTAANRLLNKIAHTLDQLEIQYEMNRLRADFLAALTSEQAEAMKELDDIRVPGEAFQLCGAYLVAAALVCEREKPDPPDSVSYRPAG
jgi:hypothetical protein